MRKPASSPPRAAFAVLLLALPAAEKGSSASGSIPRPLNCARRPGFEAVVIGSSSRWPAAFFTWSTRFFASSCSRVVSFFSTRKNFPFSRSVGRRTGCVCLIGRHKMDAADGLIVCASSLPSRRIARVTFDLRWRTFETEGRAAAAFFFFTRTFHPVHRHEIALAHELRRRMSKRPGSQSTTSLIECAGRRALEILVDRDRKSPDIRGGRIKLGTLCFLPLFFR